MPATGVFVLGRDATGFVAEDRDPGYRDGFFRYYLTDCCGASAKGLDDYVGCRSCYDEISPMLGGCPEVYNFIELFGDGITWDEAAERFGWSVEP